MRQVNERVSQWSCGRYFLFWAGDELLLNSTNDGDAIREGEALVIEVPEGTQLDTADLHSPIYLNPMTAAASTDRSSPALPSRPPGATPRPSPGCPARR